MPIRSKYVSICDHIIPVLESLHWVPVRFRVDFNILMLSYVFCLAYMWCSGTSRIVRRWHITWPAFIDHRPNFNATSLLQLETTVVVTIYSRLIQKNKCSHIIIFVDDTAVMSLITKAICAASNAELFWQEGHGRYDDMHMETLFHFIIS